MLGLKVADETDIVLVKRLKYWVYLKPHGQQGSANELDTRHEISHQVEKRDFGLNERFVHSLRAAGQNNLFGPEMAKNSPSETQSYAGKFFAYAEPSLSFELHSGNGHRVRFNSDPSFPQILERIEGVELPKP